VACGMITGISSSGCICTWQSSSLMPLFGEPRLNTSMRADYGGYEIAKQRTASLPQSLMLSQCQAPWPVRRKARPLKSAQLPVQLRAHARVQRLPPKPVGSMSEAHL
jgi:hypothetical protein